MKKRIFAILIILAFAFSLIACNASSDSVYDAPEYTPGASDQLDKESDIYGEAVIKNATVHAETKEFETAVDSLSALISKCGGHIFSSNLTKNPSYSGASASERRANYVIKIPSKNLDAFLKGLEGFLNVTSLSTSAQDVSEELYDLESTLETQKKKRDTLRTMLDEVDSSTQWSYYWQISNELDSVEAQIARIQAELSELEGKIAYSTVTFSLYEVLVLSEAGDPTFGQQIGDAFMASITTLLEILKGLLIALIFMIPFAIVGGLIAFIIVLIVRVSKKKRRKTAKPDSTLPPQPPQSPYSGYGPYDQI